MNLEKRLCVSSAFLKSFLGTIKIKTPDQCLKNSSGVIFLRPAPGSATTTTTF